MNLFDESPLTKNIRNSTILDEKVMETESFAVLQNKLRDLLTYLVRLRIVMSIQCDKIKVQ